MRAIAIAATTIFASVDALAHPHIASSAPLVHEALHTAEALGLAGLAITIAAGLVLLRRRSSR
ncbi:MAG: hypothetical protein AAF493_21450 [Pseudomonadota bacterium]